jgi:hypothetical protein
MAIKLRAVIKHPAQVVAETGLAVRKANGTYAFSLDLGAFAETPTIVDQEAATLLLVTPGATEADPDVYERMEVDDFLALAVNFDAELAAIAGLTSAANTVPYFTGSGTAALAGFTEFGRSLVDDANAGAALTTLGVSAFAQTILDDATAEAALTTLGISPFSQTILDDANAAAVLTTLGVSAFAQALLDDATAGAALTTLGVSTFAQTVLDDVNGAAVQTTLGISAFAQTILDDADATAVRATIEAQATDAELTALAGLTSAANKLPYFTGPGTAALTDISAFARTLLDDTSGNAARTTLSAASSGANMIAGSGLTGGGDLSADRTFNVGAGEGIAVNDDNVALNVNALTEDVAPDGANDFVPVYDASGTNHRKVRLSNLPSAGGAGVAEPFVTIGNPAGLVNERALGATAPIVVTDNGAGNSVVISVNAASDSAAGIQENADQAEMEAFSAANRTVTPFLQRHHPGHPKAWVRATSAAVVTAAHRVSSISSLGVGQERVNLTDTYSSANAYAAFACASATSGARMVSIDTYTTGNFEVFTKDGAGAPVDTGFTVDILGDI